MLLLVTGLLLWSAGGLVSSWYLRRQGHNGLLFAALGLALGPLIVPIARRSKRDSEFVATEIASGTALDGWIDVLVGLGGDVDDVVSVRAVVDTLGPAIRRLRIALVLDVETGNAPDLFDADEHAAEHLRFAARALGHPDAELVLLAGRPDEALVQHAVEQHMNMLTIGHRGHRVLSALLGSTAARLARTAQVSIVIGPRPDRELASGLRAEGAISSPDSISLTDSIGQEEASHV